jgi:hypothetical protein
MASADLFFAALASEFRVPTLPLLALLREKCFERVEVHEPEVLNAAAVNKCGSREPMRAASRERR